VIECLVKECVPRGGEGKWKFEIESEERGEREDEGKRRGLQTISLLYLFVIEWDSLWTEKKGEWGA